jgi:hypothetical protein
VNGEGSRGDAQQLAEFFSRLAEDRALYNDYLTDPLGTMRSANLSEELIGAVLTGDLHHLNKKFTEEFAAVIILGTIVCG